jgi:glycosyltransferase involved in cell wall biosynthesis
LNKTIAINARLLLKHRNDGITRFSIETCKQLVSMKPNWHFIFLFDRTPHPDFITAQNITPLVLSPQARHPFLYYLWFEWSVAGTLNKLKPDLFLSPDGFLSLNAKCKQLPVMHDINFLHYPNDLPYLLSKYYNFYFPKFAHKAKRIATVSEYSKQDIAKNYTIENEKIDVVYNGISEIFNTEIVLLNTLLPIKKQEYFIFIGSLHPRKNIATLFHAFELFKEKNTNPIKLLIVGEKLFLTQEINEAYSKNKFKDDILFTGKVDDKILAMYLKNALALTYIPYFEGFGLPLVEAMQCEVPIITSNVSSLPEVAQDAALYAEPNNINEIAKNMFLIYNDKTVCNKLILEGKQRVKNFSWQKTSTLLLNSIEKCL